MIEKEQFIRALDSCAEQTQEAFNRGVRAEYAGAMRGLVWAWTGGDPGPLQIYGDALEFCKFQFTVDSKGRVVDVEGIKLV